MLISLVAFSYQPPRRSTIAANAVDTRANSTSNVIEDTSVDQLVATNIAAGIAERANLPIAFNVANLNQSLQVETTFTQTQSDSVIAKPQIVQPTAGSRVVQEYVAKTGDTIQIVAATYKLSPDTIKWANNMTSDAIEPNRTLKIPPIDGIIYAVKAGDTIESIAAKYKASADIVRTYNNLEKSGVTAGSQIIIPDGQLPENERPGYVAPRTPNRSATGGAAVRVNSSIAMASAGNRYGAGYCTWYAYERRMQLGRPIGSFWGNASSWVYSARSAGIGVGSEPQPGAIMQNGGGAGHVAIVESVVPGVSVTISEMNGYRWGGGFGRVSGGTLDWNQAVNPYYTYIY